jgi:hypothetical protein
VRITAFEKPLDDLLFDQPLEAAFGAKRLRVPLGAPVQCARTRVARPIHAARWFVGNARHCPPLGRSAITLDASSHEANNAAARACGHAAHGKLWSLCNLL